MPDMNSSSLPPLETFSNEQKTIGERPIKVNLADVANQIETDPIKHRWRQKGPYVVCTSCKVKHAMFVGLTNQLSQIKSNGKLVFEKVGAPKPSSLVADADNDE